MNFLAWLLALTLMVIVMIEAVALHQVTVCRQKAWLKSTELQTSTLLYRPKEHDQLVVPSCQVYVVLKNKKVSWRRLPNLSRHAFNLPLSGKI